MGLSKETQSAYVISTIRPIHTLEFISRVWLHYLASRTSPHFRSHVQFKPWKWTPKPSGDQSVSRALTMQEGSLASHITLLSPCFNVREPAMHAGKC